MNQEQHKVIVNPKNAYSHEIDPSRLNREVKNQEIFYISSPKFSHPSKKPCKLDCSHHLHPHNNHQLPYPQKGQEETSNIYETIETFDVSQQRKCKIYMSDHNLALPCLQHSNELCLKQSNTLNDINVSKTKFEDRIICKIHFDPCKEDKKPNLDLNNVLDCKEASSILHQHPSLNNHIKNSSYRSKLNLENSHKLYRNVLIQKGAYPVSTSSHCDMHHYLNQLSIISKRLLKKKLTLIGAVAVIFFLFGVAIQFLSNVEDSSSYSKSYYAGLTGMKPHYVKKGSTSGTNSKNILNNLFISVKTTQRYHYPRVIVQLETWASLVKEQVIDFDNIHNKLITHLISNKK